jgi:hypothetical protein
VRRFPWIALACGLFAPCLGMAAQPWPYEQTAGVFHCHSTFNLEPHRALFDELGQLERDLHATLGLAKVRSHVHVYLLESQTAYQQYVQQYFPDVPYRRALFVRTRGPGMVFAFANDEFAVDVRHESTHALLHSSLPSVPLWLDEGLAEYFEVDRALRAMGNPHLARVQWSLRVSRVPSLEALEAKTTLGEMDKSDYRHAWAWTHWMLHGPEEAHDELVRYLSDIQAGTPAGKLSERLRRRIPNLEEAFASHFHNWQ